MICSDTDRVCNLFSHWYSLFRILSNLIIQFKKIGKTDRDKSFLSQCFLFVISD